MFKELIASSLTLFNDSWLHIVDVSYVWRHCQDNRWWPSLVLLLLLLLVLNGTDALPHWQPVGSYSVLFDESLSQRINSSYSIRKVLCNPMQERIIKFNKFNAYNWSLVIQHNLLSIHYKFIILVCVGVNVIGAEFLFNLTQLIEQMQSPEDL